MTQSNYVPESSSRDVDNRLSGYKDRKSELTEQQFRVLWRSRSWQCCQEESGQGGQRPERAGRHTKSSLIRIGGGRQASERA